MNQPLLQKDNYGYNWGCIEAVYFGIVVNLSQVLLMNDRSTKEMTVIQHTVGWGSLDLRSVWEYRQLLYLFTWREIKGKYRQMAFGPLWIILMPLLNMVVFSVIFGRLAKMPSDGLPYPIFSYIGLLPWQLFSTAVSQSTNSLVVHKGMMSKVYFPRLISPLSTSLSALVDFVMSFGIMLGMMYFYGFMPTTAILVLPIYLLLIIVTSLVVGMCLAALAVKFHDVSFGVRFLVQIWFYATPIVYPLSVVPEKWRILYYLNPMTCVIEGFRWALLGKGQGPGLALVVTIIVVFALLIPAAFYFRRTERSIVDLA